MSTSTPTSEGPVPVWFERAHWPGMDEVRRAGIEVLSPEGTGDPYAGVEGAVAIAAGVRPYDGPVMDRAPRLAVIARTGIGYDSVDLAEATRRGIAVCNTPDGPTIATAEHAIALMLAVAKRLPNLQHDLRQQDRKRMQAHNSTELFGKLLGLVGFGRIARRVAAAAAGLGMRVTAYDPFLSEGQFGSVTRAADLEEMLAAADVVSIHIPLTDQSRGLFNEQTLSVMKRDAILINTARGGLVDTTALVEAVADGHLKAVGLDVTDPEPLPPHHPLLQFDNVLVTPHVASWTSEAKRRMVLTTAEQILALLKGDECRNLVNTEVLSRPNLRLPGTLPGVS